MRKIPDSQLGVSLLLPGVHATKGTPNFPNIFLPNHSASQMTRKVCTCPLLNGLPKIELPFKSLFVMNFPQNKTINWQFWCNCSVSTNGFEKNTYFCSNSVSFRVFIKISHRFVLIWLTDFDLSSVPTWTMSLRPNIRSEKRCYRTLKNRHSRIRMITKL